MPWPLIVMGVSAGISAFAKWKASQAAKKAGQLSAKAAGLNAGLIDFNAWLVDIQAEDATRRGAEQESNFRAGVRGLIGEQRTQFAASGVDIGYGSAEDVQVESAFRGELDALQIRTNAMRETWGLQVKALDLRRQAQIMRETGQLQAEAAAAGQGAALISIAGDVASAAGGIGLMSRRYGMAGT